MKAFWRFLLILPCGLCDPRHVHHRGSWLFEKSGENPTLAYPFPEAGEILLPLGGVYADHNGYILRPRHGCYLRNRGILWTFVEVLVGFFDLDSADRAVMGFVIGASGLRLHWAWHGIVIGVVVGSIFSYFLFMTLGPGSVPPVNAVVNGIFGLVIEFFTTKVCKRPAFSHAQKMGSTLSSLRALGGRA